MVGVHDLARQAEPYARAFGLGGEEGDEDLCLAFECDGLAIVDHSYCRGVVSVYCCADHDVVGFCQDGILDQVDKDAADL